MSAIMFRIAHEEPDLEGIPEGMLRTLITDCLVKEPAGRPTVDELLSRTTEHRPEAGAWLLGDLTARLRRQAVQLLEVEYPGRPWPCLRRRHTAGPVRPATAAVARGDAPPPGDPKRASVRHHRSGTWRHPRHGDPRIAPPHRTPRPTKPLKAPRGWANLLVLLLRGEVTPPFKQAAT